MSSSNSRRVCVVLVDRANYGRLRPVMQEVRDRPELSLQVVAAGTMVLERFHQPVNVVQADGFDVHSRIFMELEGSTPTTMAKSVGFGIVEFAGELQRLQPDVVLVIGDRYEALAATVAASFMNIPVAHVQGGEVSGSIDESTRHAISKYAQFHFPSTQRSAEFLIRMGERPDTILAVGCPGSDLARQLDTSQPLEFLNAQGSGAVIDADRPFILSVFHPTTTEFGLELTQMDRLLEALHDVGTQTVLLWPNIDAGSDHISKAIRVFRDTCDAPWLRVLTNLTPEQYLLVLNRAACAVGNSSSFVRDSSYFGTPVVLVGNRQNGRETAKNVVASGAQKGELVGRIQNQLKHGRYDTTDLYGDGHVAPRIAEALATAPLYVQKRLAFLDD